MIRAGVEAPRLCSAGAAWMKKPLTYNAELVGREDHTGQLATFQVKPDEAPGRAGLRFEPGQYLALGLNNEARPDRDPVRRSMSIASAPQQRGTLEFYIRYVSEPASDNPLTHLLWQLSPGDRLYVTRKPAGRFTIAATCGAADPRRRLLVAAGTGLAPFIAIVRSAVLADPRADLSRYILLHGASYPADLSYRDELDGYRERNGLRYFNTISRPREVSGWRGDTGRVEDFLRGDRLAALEERAGLGAGGLHPGSVAILVCGLQGTIAETVTRLAPRGFVPHHRRLRSVLQIPAARPPSIWWEQYDTAPVIDVSDENLVASLKAHLSRARGPGEL